MISKHRANAQGSDPSAFVGNVGYPSPFDELTLALCQDAKRCVRIQSPLLDHQVFDNKALQHTLSALARKSRHTWVHILINDSTASRKRGHALLELARRLSSSVSIKKLEHHPQWNGETVIISDNKGVLYKPGDVDHEAFYQPDSAASAQRHADRFDEIWQRAREDRELRQMSI